MAIVTLANLRNSARVRSDLRVSSIFSDGDFNDAINGSISEVYDLQVLAWGENAFLTSSVFPLVSGQQLYTVPQNLYKIFGVDWAQAAGNPYITMENYEFNERNRLNSVNLNISTYPGGTNMRYCYYGSSNNGLSQSLSFMPIPNAANQIQLWYVPSPTPLVNDSDSFNFYAGFDEYVILDAAIKACVAEETDVSMFMAQKSALYERLRDSITHKDVNNSHSVTDVENLNDGWGFW